jgi:translation initiation factor IF-2
MDACSKMLTEAGEQAQLNLMVKADTQGSVEAIVDSLRDIRSEKIGLEIITPASATSTTTTSSAPPRDALIVGFQVGLESGVRRRRDTTMCASRPSASSTSCFDHVKQAMLDLLPPEYREVVQAATPRSACHLRHRQEGQGRRLPAARRRHLPPTRVRVLSSVPRVIFDGRILSLRHFQDEVQRGEATCRSAASFFDGFEAFAEGDIVECYSLVELERTLYCRHYRYCRCCSRLGRRPPLPLAPRRYCPLSPALIFRWSKNRYDALINPDCAL